MMMFKVALVLAISLAIAAPSSGFIFGACGLWKPLYSTSAPTTAAANVGYTIFETNVPTYTSVADPLNGSLQLGYKGADYEDLDRSTTDKNFYTLEVRRGIFEIEGQNQTVSLKLAISATDIGIVIDACYCKQFGGEETLDFCNVFLREQLFKRIAQVTCIFSNNTPFYCCN